MTRLSTLAIVITLALALSSGTAAAGEFVPFGAEWDWLHQVDGAGVLANPNDSDADFESTWKLGIGAFAAQYDGPVFSSGPALLGYGSIGFGPIITNIGTPAGGGRGTAYFRLEFTAGAAEAGNIFKLEALTDDGAVFYLDGLEVQRNNFTGADTFTAFAAGVGDEDSTATLNIAPISAGPHVWAVSVHQANATSSDLGFDLRAFDEPPPPPPVPGVIEVRVISGNDDAEEHLTAHDGAANRIDLGSSDLEIGAEGGNPDAQLIGIRFQNVPIPAGSIIQSASIQFTVDEDDDEPTSVPIFGELSANPLEYGSNAGNISSRPRTVAEVAWNDIPSWSGAGTAGPDQETPDLTAIVQEIIDQDGWASGNSLAIMIGGGAGMERTAESFNGSAGEAPLLKVHFNPIPEPSTLVLAALGLLGLLGFTHRRRK